MKYITTDTHPELKEGIIIYKGISDYRSDFFMSLCNTFNIKTWEAQGYIKEVEEKEYTKSDLKICFNAGCKFEKTGSIYLSFEEVFKRLLE